MRAAKLALALVVTAFLALPAALTAQEQEEEMPQPERYDTSWYEIVHVDYKPGKADEAFELVREHYIATEEEADLPGPEMELIHTTGQWDATYIWHLDDGPSDLTWKTSPEEIEFMQAFREHAGGDEEAQEIMERYQSYVQDSKVILTRSLRQE